MSLDSIPHSGRTGLDELVPSRYAVKVGDIDVMVISDGVLPITAVTMATNVALRSCQPGSRTCTCRRRSSTGR